MGTQVKTDLKPLTYHLEVDMMRAFSLASSLFQWPPTELQLKIPSPVKNPPLKMTTVKLLTGHFELQTRSIMTLKNIKL